MNIKTFGHKKLSGLIQIKQQKSGVFVVCLKCGITSK